MPMKFSDEHLWLGYTVFVSAKQFKLSVGQEILQEGNFIIIWARNITAAAFKFWNLLLAFFLIIGSFTVLNANTAEETK